MSGNTDGRKRNIWIRGLFMLLMGFAFQVCGTVIQFVMTLLSDSPNSRLVLFGRITCGKSSICSLSPRKNYRSRSATGLQVNE